jgi:hypothetical protein
MSGETGAALFESGRLAHLGARLAPPREVALGLAVALLLGIDLGLDAQRGELRLHLVLEVGAALLTLLVAGRGWLRHARSAARERRNEPAPLSVSDVECYIDARLWSAIAAALREEAEPALLITPRRLAPAPPG